MAHAVGPSLTDVADIIFGSLKSADRVDRLELFKGAAQTAGAKQECCDTLSSSGSSLSGASSLSSPGSPTGPLPQPPCRGFWGVLRALVGENHTTRHSSDATGKQQEGSPHREKAKGDAQRIKTRAPIRSDSNRSEHCDSARANDGHLPTSVLKSPRSSEFGSLGDAEELCHSWQLQYEAATRLLQAHLNTGTESDALRDAVADVYSALQAVVALRQAALREDRVEEVLAGAFFRLDQRLLLWMGGIRPTDMLACARIKMSMVGERLDPRVQGEVEALQTACRARQAALTKGFEELSEKLARAATVAQLVVAARAPGERWGRHAFGCDADLRASVAQGCEGVRIAMTNLLIQADELRARLLEQLAGMLTPRQLALVLMAPLDMVASPL